MKICLRLLHLTVGIWKGTSGMNGLFGSTTMPLREALRPLIERIAIWQIDRRAPGARRTPDAIEPFAPDATVILASSLWKSVHSAGSIESPEVEMTGLSLIAFRLLIQFAL